MLLVQALQQADHSLHIVLMQGSSSLDAGDSSAQIEVAKNHKKVSEKKQTLLGNILKRTDHFLLDRISSLKNVFLFFARTLYFKHV